MNILAPSAALDRPVRVRWSPPLAYSTAGAAGLAIFLLEISAGRLLAPALGVSLETWAGIIGIVLAGYAAGDAAGGALADRLPSPRLLAATLVAAGTAVIAAVPLAAAVQGVWLGVPLFLRVVLVAAGVLLLPSTLLGAVGPMVARLTLRTTDDAGRVAGGLSAVATAGSILGVVAGGFILPEHLGVRAITVGNGALLLLLAAIPVVAAPGQARRPDRAAQIEARAVASARLRLPLLLAALGGAAVMAVELAGARLAAPLLGNSLYTWTSVIGTTMLGISLGNALGGRWVDRHPTPDLVGQAFAVAGAGALAALLMPYLYSRLWPGLTDALLAALPPAVGLPLLIGAMLFPAALGFGAISPIVIRLIVPSVREAGQVVGRVYAAQALGSIAGTFATGFLLISQLGSRATILLVAEGTILVGVLLAGGGAGRRSLVRTAAVGAFAVTAAAVAAGVVPSPCLRESNYYCIRILDDAPPTRALALDGLIHSYVNPGDPTDLHYDYEAGWAALVAEHVPRLGIEAPRALFIGGGGYVFPRYLQHLYPASQIEVVEIDPAVTRVAQEELGLAPGAPLVTWNEDGRQFFLRRTGRRYDFVFTDVFRDAYSIPAHLTTREFGRLVAATLAPQGVYAVNIVDGRHGLFVRSYVRTLQQVFRHVYLLPAGADWRENVRTIFVVFAAQRPLDLQRISAQTPPGVRRLPLVPLTDAALADYLAGGPSLLLTDDRAPVDRFLARVFAEAMRER